MQSIRVANEALQLIRVANQALNLNSQPGPVTVTYHTNLKSIPVQQQLNLAKKGNSLRNAAITKIHQ
jgi:hypothetical protein